MMSYVQYLFNFGGVLLKVVERLRGSGGIKFASQKVKMALVFKIRVYSTKQR